MHTGFWVKEDVSLGSFIRNMLQKSKRYGLDKVMANRGINVRDIENHNVNDADYPEAFAENDRFSGLNYAFFKGPSGEQNVLMQFKGNAARVLQNAMEKYGTLSTAFSSTNPWNWAGFDRTCEWVDETDDDDEVIPPEQSSASKAALYLPLLLLAFFFK
jgi:hypothetical protein